MARKSRKSYHHGNLKEALIDAGRQLIVEKGPHGFSLVEAARIADVSPAAPYRHFPNQKALLIEIAKHGFRLFAEVLEKAWNNGQPDSLTAFSRMGEAYIEFSRKDRASYAAMFQSGLHPSIDKELEQESQRAFDILYQIAEHFNASLPETEKISPDLIFAHIWALSHGTSTLFGTHGFSSPTGHTNAQTLLKTGIDTYLKGLGLSNSSKS